MAKATYLLRKAGELVKERKYQDAVEVYLQATETDSSDARAWFGLGVCLYKVDNLDVARIALERALKMGYPKAQDALARVGGAEQRRAAEGKGAKRTAAPAEVRQRAVRRPDVQEPPPRPAERADEDKLDLGRYLRVMLVENIESDRTAVTRAIEGNIRDIQVNPVEFGVSTSDTMSGTVHYDVAILDWDSGPDAATGLIQILKIKRPALLVICLTEKWDPESAAEILEAGADYHLVKERHFAAMIPLILAQWTKRDRALALQIDARGSDAPDVWPAALEAFGEALMLVDADLTIVQANPAATKQFRKGEDEVVGRSYCVLLYGEDEPPYSCPIARALERGRPGDGEVVRKATNEALRVKAWPVVNAAGKVTGAIALVRPADAAETVSQDLRTREWLYRNLTERANAGVAMVGPDGKVQYANPMLCTMLDQTEDELLNRPVESFAPPQQQEVLRGCIRTAVERGEAAERIALERADGNTVPADLRVARFKADEGNYLVLTALGATEQEQAEQELWTEARKFAALLDEGMDRLECGVVVLDSQGSVSWANALAAQLLGRERDALLGAPYLEVAAEGFGDMVQGAQEFLDTLSGVHETGVSLEDHALALSGPEAESLTYWSTPVESRSPAVCRIEHFYRAAAPASAPVQAPPVETLGPLADLAEAVPEMLFTVDPEGAVSWSNRASANVAGYTNGQLAGMPLADLATAEERDKVLGLIQQATQEAGRPQSAQVLMARPDGQRYWGEITLVAVRGNADQPGQILQGFLRDVTESRMAQAIRQIVSAKQPV